MAAVVRARRPDWQRPAPTASDDCLRPWPGLACGMALSRHGALVWSLWAKPDIAAHKGRCVGESSRTYLRKSSVSLPFRYFSFLSSTSKQNIFPSSFSLGLFFSLGLSLGLSLVSPWSLISLFPISYFPSCLVFLLDRGFSRYFFCHESRPPVTRHPTPWY